VENGIIDEVCKYFFDEGIGVQFKTANRSLNGDLRFRADERGGDTDRFFDRNPPGLDRSGLLVIVGIFYQVVDISEDLFFLIDIG